MPSVKNYNKGEPNREAFHDMPPPHNRPSWDLTSVLYGVMPNRGYFKLSAPGRVTVDDDAFTRFDPQEQGTRRFLLLDPGQVERVREALVQLASEPPCAP